jgi:hypothetical protein
MSRAWPAALPSGNNENLDPEQAQEILRYIDDRLQEAWDMYDFLETTVLEHPFGLFQSRRLPIWAMSSGIPARKCIIRLSLKRWAGRF